MFMDEQRYDVWDEIRQRDIRAFSEVLTPSLLLGAAKRSGVRLVKSPLCILNLVWLGIAAALHATDSFASVLIATLKILEDQQNFPRTTIGKVKQEAKRNKRDKRSKHDPRRNDPTQVTEEAFAKARQRMPFEYWVNLIILLGESFELRHPSLHCFRGLRVLALDGTRIDLPNYIALKEYFGAAKNRTGSHQVQGRMVMLQFPTTRLPYRYEFTPLGDSETTVAKRLVQHLRANDLLLMDAGFWSYGLLWAIAHQQAYFAIRLRKNLNLQTLRKLRPDGKDRLVRWSPKDSRRNWRKQNLPAGMDLRVVQYQVPGFRMQSLVTSVTDPKKISREDWTRLTTDCEDAGRKLLPGLFHRRWEIETSYHELKVDLRLDSELRSRTVASLQYEIAGFMVLYLLIRYLMAEAAVKHGIDPLRISFTEAKRELETMRPSLVIANLDWAVDVLIPRLLDRIASHIVPLQPGRHFPRKKKKKKNAQTKSAKRCSKKKNCTCAKKKCRGTRKKQKQMSPKVRTKG